MYKLLNTDDAVVRRKVLKKFHLAKLFEEVTERHFLRDLELGDSGYNRAFVVQFVPDAGQRGPRILVVIEISEDRHGNTRADLGGAAACPETEDEKEFIESYEKYLRTHRWKHV
jgi:hypothetical protein